MNTSQLLNIKILPYKITKSLGKQLGVSETTHLSYKAEKQLLTCIMKGDLKKLIEELKIFSNTIGVGEMSSDNLNQYKYIAVSTITLATRYAIEGGLNDADAYYFSDMFIKNIDNLNSPDAIMNAIVQAVIKITNSVAEEKARLCHSPYVRKVISYINENISKKIMISELSDFCGLSADYLSHMFKTEMGENLSSYILRTKLDISKGLLLEGLDNEQICNALSFSSQSHYISVFKKQYGLTPKQFVLTTK